MPRLSRPFWMPGPQIQIVQNSVLIDTSAVLSTTDLVVASKACELRDTSGVLLSFV